MLTQQGPPGMQPGEAKEEVSNDEAGLALGTVGAQTAETGPGRDAA